MVLLNIVAVAQVVAELLNEGENEDEAVGNVEEEVEGVSVGDAEVLTLLLALEEKATEGVLIQEKDAEVDNNGDEESKGEIEADALILPVVDTLGVLSDEALGDKLIEAEGEPDSVAVEVAEPEELLLQLEEAVAVAETVAVWETAALPLKTPEDEELAETAGEKEALLL